MSNNTDRMNEAIIKIKAFENNDLYPWLLNAAIDVINVYKFDQWIKLESSKKVIESYNDLLDEITL